MEITKQNGNIAFSEPTHVYWDVSDGEKKFISVTTLIERYAQPFDKDFWSAYKAFQKLIPQDEWKTLGAHLRSKKKIDVAELCGLYDIEENLFNKEQQSILDEWAKANRESCERGTKIHSELENSFYNAGKNVELKKFGIGGKFECRKDYTELNLPYGVYPEYLISRSSDDGILNLAGQIDCLVKNGNEITIIDHKGLPLDTPILTTKGWSTMQDLKVGDKIFDKDGNECNITVKSEVHHNPCYKIMFDNSESIIADVDHRWYISFKHENSDKHVVMTTRELKNYLESKQLIYGTPKILNTKPINPTNNKTLPLDPYLFGVWLINGSNIGAITQYANSPIWEKFKNAGFEVRDNLMGTYKKFEIRSINGLNSILQTIGVLNNKHIPEEYLLASYEDRLSLLRGLMDTDGYYDSTNKKFVVRTLEKWEMDGLKQLLSSLGCKVTIIGHENKFSSWEISFATNSFNPFLIKNQEFRTIDDNFRNIESVEEVGMVPTQCIAVDSPSHTYLCTHSLIVTHNTNKKIDTKSFFDSVKKSSTKMKYPLNKLDDCNFYHYTLQLSTYAWMLQKINPNFVIKDLILNHYDHEGNNTLYHCDYLKHEVELMLAHYKRELIKQRLRAKFKRVEY